MRLTHFGHSCLLVELDGTRILFDPGTLSSGFEALTDLDAILITHQHPDHADVARLPAIVEANPTAVRYADPQTTEQLNASGAAGEWTSARPGDTFPIGSVTARVTGGRHAVIHPALQVVDNSAFILDAAAQRGAFMHPGDSLYIPFERIDVLALPAAAPWLKLSEAVDYLRAVAPRVGVPIHQAVLSAGGIAVHNARLSEMKDPATQFLPLDDAVATEV